MAGFGSRVLAIIVLGLAAVLEGPGGVACAERPPLEQYVVEHSGHLIHSGTPQAYAQGHKVNTAPPSSRSALANPRAVVVLLRLATSKSVKAWQAQRSGEVLSILRALETMAHKAKASRDVMDLVGLAVEESQQADNKDTVLQLLRLAEERGLQDQRVRLARESPDHRTQPMPKHAPRLRRRQAGGFNADSPMPTDAAATTPEDSLLLGRDAEPSTTVAPSRVADANKAIALKNGVYDFMSAGSAQIQQSMGELAQDLTTMKSDSKSVKSSMGEYQQSIVELAQTLAEADTVEKEWAKKTFDQVQKAEAWRLQPLTSQYTRIDLKLAKFEKIVNGAAQGGDAATGQVGDNDTGRQKSSEVPAPAENATRPSLEEKQHVATDIARAKEKRDKVMSTMEAAVAEGLAKFG